MKKLIFIMLVSLWTISLTACSGVESNTIVEAELTDRENEILSTTSKLSFVFDFNIDNEYKEVSLWIEKYEFGELVDERGGIGTEVMEEGSIIFTTNEPINNQNETLFTIGVISNEGTASGRTSDLVPVQGTEGRFTIVGNINEEMDITDEEIVLASIGFSWEESISSFSPDLYTNAEHRSTMLENYEVAYLLVTKFTK